MRTHPPGADVIQEQDIRRAGHLGIQQASGENTACIHELFEAQVALTPQATALSGRGWSVSYQELNERANRLAHHLRSLGVGPEILVGLLLPRSRDAVIGILAILKSGGAYLPLEPAYPVERLNFLLEDSGARVVLSQESHVPPGLTRQVNLVLLDHEEAALAQASPENPPLLADASTLAYMIYTSGSTGTPKGVLIEHTGVGNLVLGQTYTTFGPQEVHLLLASLAFDFSTLELWGALLHGARLAVYDQPFMSLTELGRTIREEGVSTLMITPGLLSHLVDERLPDLAGLRRVLTGGDVASVKTARAVLGGIAGCEFTNIYGPTENTVLTTAYTLHSSEQLENVIPIGRAIHGTETHVVNDEGQQVARGEVGELWLGGLGLARGYANRTELTAQRFVPHPFSARPGARLYHTGDLVREREDGQLEFLGRRDFQVKVRGHRIELPEIERALREHRGVQEAVVLALTQGVDQEKRLVAFVQTTPAQTTSAQTAAAGATSHLAPCGEDLRVYLGHRLPAYMVPSVLVLLEALPLSPTGKVDRNALKTWPLPSGPGQGDMAPMSAPETQMGQLWTEVLGVRPGPHDDFFALGGTSLLAALLLSRVATLMGCELSPSIFFERPTVRSLCAFIGDRQTGSETQAATDGLVRLSRGGGPAASSPDSSHSPLVLIGDPYLYRLLLPHLGPGETVYAVHQEIQAVSEMAVSVREALRKAQIRGPFRLCGFSYEGLVAYELARLLRAEGEQVSFLGLIDTATPDVERQTLKPFRSRIWLYLNNLGWLIHADRRGLMFSKAAHSLKRRFRLIKKPETDPNFELRRALLNRYTPQPYSGAVLLFRASAEVSHLYDPLLGWGALTGGQIEVVDIRGGHLDLLCSEQGSRQVGSALAAHLRGS